MTTCTADRLAAFVSGLPGGVLSYGRHDDDDDPRCCLLEAVSLCEGRPKTDDPGVLWRPDVRPINDTLLGLLPAAEGTALLLRLAPLLADWATWAPAQRADFARRVALGTLRDVLPLALRDAGLDAHAAACQRAETLEEAGAARAAAAAARADADAALAAAAAAGADALRAAIALWERCHAEVAAAQTGGAE